MTEARIKAEEFLRKLDIAERQADALCTEYSKWFHQLDEPEKKEVRALAIALEKTP